MGLNESFVVGYIGTHGMAHALANVLDRTKTLRDVPRVNFFLVGNGAERDQLITSAQERGLDNVVFIKFQPKEAMRNVWSLCDVALVHLKNSQKFSEVIPSKIFEAMAMQRPILIAAPKGVASRPFTAVEARCWVPPENPKALAEVVCGLNDDARFITNMAVRL